MFLTPKDLNIVYVFLQKIILTDSKNKIIKKRKKKNKAFIQSITPIVL
jgi:hypothetical protein